MKLRLSLCLNMIVTILLLTACSERHGSVIAKQDEAAWKSVIAHVEEA